jgi:hypothetical protein
MMYGGQERRMFKVLITRNTEYHMRGDECIAVRDTRTGQWQGQHVALGRQLVGSIGADATGSYRVMVGSEPPVGSRLCFSSDLLTSPLLVVRRPTEKTLTNYRLSA